MFFGQSREEIRQFYFDSWAKYKTKEIMTPLETQICDVILMHPEYHDMMDNPEKYQDKDYTPEAGETNPFLHMGFHLGIHEQVSTNRPTGIKDIYNKLSAKYNDPHQAEHQMIELLAEMLWEAQRNNLPPDNQAYIEKLRSLI